METGVQIRDTQCGLRIYPLAAVNGIPCRSEDSGFETEMVVRALWAELPVLQAPIHRGPASGTDSDPKPIADFPQAIRLHTRLFLIAMNPFHPAGRPPGSGPRHSIPRQFLHWLNPLTAWRQIRHDEGARTRFAAGCAVGIWIANLPLYGIQTLVGLYVARRFRLHPASVVAGVNVTVPPIGPLMIAFGIALGHFILHGAWPHLDTYHLTDGQWRKELLPILIDWIVGSHLLGLVMAVITFFGMDFILRLVVDPPGEREVKSIAS
jgi:uncharacterized protein (DUF2062 family)